MGGGSCTSSNTDEEKNILIPQEELSVSIAADSGLNHTVNFETKAEWTASVRETTRGDAWISIAPTSGSAGRSQITITLSENPDQTSRTAVITILCGGESVTITITQRGVGEPEDPEDPDGPEHPEVAPENRLTYIEVTDTKTFPIGGPGGNSEVYIDKYYLTLAYDAQGKLATYSEYSFDRNQPQYLDNSYISTITQSAGKLSIEEEYFEITGGENPDFPPTARQGVFSSDFQLNKNGSISNDTWDGEPTNFTYNADGTLAKQASLSYNQTYTWKDGDLMSITATGSGVDNTVTYTYSEHLNPWQGVDLAGLLFDDMDGCIPLLGITGTTPKHLPQSAEDIRNSSFRYEYTFDGQGRVSTIVVLNNEGNPNDNVRSEYKLNYGNQNPPKHDYLLYLTKQEVVDEGTLNYTFEPENPNEHSISDNSYTSYVKIRSMFSDGSTRDNTKYEMVIVHVDPGYDLESIEVTQDEIDAFKLLSTSLTKDPLTEGVINPQLYTFSLTYNCFMVELQCETYTPYCSIYVGNGNREERPMPTLPLTKDCFSTSTPQIWKGNESPTMISYEFSHQFTFNINPACIEPYPRVLTRNLRVLR